MNTYLEKRDTSISTLSDEKKKLIQARILVLTQMVAEYERKGFKNCKAVVEAHREKQELKAEETRIRYFEKYPNYLYLTDEEFNDVLKRNNLVVSEVERYVGDIPASCWEAIKNEKVDEEDLFKYYEYEDIPTRHSTEVGKGGLVSDIFLSNVNRVAKSFLTRNNNKVGLKIACPRELLRRETSNLSLDPIVFRYLKDGGVLVITFWK